MKETLKRIFEINKKFIPSFMIAVMVFAIATTAHSANAATSNPSVKNVQTVTDVDFGENKASDKMIADFKIVSNYRTVSEAKIKKAKKAGKCKTISGSQAIKMGVKTQGYMGSGIGYAFENRKTTMCDTNNDGQYDVRAECGNKLKVVTPKPKEAKAIIWVDSLGKAKAKISVLAKVEVSAKCETRNASATTYARGEARATVTVKLKNIVKSNGKIDGAGFAKIKQKAVSQASAKAQVRASGEASATCKDGTITTTKPVKPSKPQKQVDVVEVSGKGAMVEELPNTGPGAVIATFAGISTLSGLLHAVITRRFGL